MHGHLCRRVNQMFIHHSSGVFPKVTVIGPLPERRQKRLFQLFSFNLLI